MALTKPENKISINITLTGRDAIMFHRATLYSFGATKLPHTIRARDLRAFARLAVSAVALEICNDKRVFHPMAVTMRTETEAETAARLDYDRQIDLADLELEGEV